jgi:hypothetical protein
MTALCDARKIGYTPNDTVRQAEELEVWEERRGFAVVRVGVRIVRVVLVQSCGAHQVAQERRARHLEDSQVPHVSEQR